MTLISLRTLLIPVVGLTGILFAYLFVGSLETVTSLTSEDHLVENLTVVAFLFGAGAAAFALWHRVHVLFSTLWLVLCIIFVGEETSWFQRTIGYNVPAIEQRNSQNEFNFHNLDFLHGSDSRSFISDDGELRFGWKRFLSSQSLFRIGFLGYFLVLPLALLLVPWGRRLATHLNMPKYELWHLVTFWSLIVLTIPMTLMIDPERRLAVAESRELLYALTIALYVASFSLRPRASVVT